MRHWYLTPTGELKRRNGVNWRLACYIVAACVVGTVFGLGIATIVMWITGATF
jgi:hypothetical protein